MATQKLSRASLLWIALACLVGCSPFESPTETELEQQASDDIRASVNQLVQVFEPANDSTLPTTAEAIRRYASAISNVDAGVDGGVQGEVLESSASGGAIHIVASLTKELQSGGGLTHHQVEVRECYRFAIRPTAASADQIDCPDEGPTPRYPANTT